MKRAKTNLAVSIHQRLLNSEPAIKFIDGRYTFVTLYKNLRARRLKIVVPQSRVRMFQRAVG